MESQTIEQLEKLANSGDINAKLQLAIAYYDGEEVPQDSQKSFRLFTEAAKCGSAEAEYWLGVCHYFGYGVPKDEQTAKTHFAKAAQTGDKNAQTALNTLTFENDELISKAAKGDVRAQYELGDFYCGCYYSRGAGLPVYSQAAFWFAKAAAQNHPEALMRLEGISVWAKDYEKISKGMQKRAWEIYARLAEEGDPAAQYEIARRCLPKENNPESSAEKAFYWFQKSAQNGHIPAFLGLAYCYCHGIGAEVDLEKGKSLLEEAGLRGNAYDKYQVALHYNNYSKIEDLKKVAFWQEKAAAAGHTLSQYNTAENYFYGRINGRYAANSTCEINYEKAVYWYKKAAEGGNREALYSVAYCYMNGLGAEKNYKKAVEIFLKLARCTHGHYGRWCLAQSANLIADCYFTGGFGIEKNLKLALNWYKSAAERDVKTACTKLGDIYRRGLGVKRDYPLAASYYEEAIFDYQDYCYGGCENYDFNANARLAECYLYGLGVEKCPDYAIDLLKDAGESMSHAPSQYLLGRCYFHGLGVKKDVVQAKAWWRSAAYDGDKIALAALKKYFGEEAATDG